MDSRNLELEHILRHLIHTEPQIEQWMAMGDVQRFAMDGMVDASFFEGSEDNKITGLIAAVKLLCKKCAYLEKELGNRNSV